jgi:prolyl oligopeptidase
MERLDDAETVEWIAGQDAATRRVLDAVHDRDWLRAQVRQATSYPRRSVPISAGPDREFCWEADEGDEKLRLVLRRASTGPQTLGGCFCVYRGSLMGSLLTNR